MVTIAVKLKPGAKTNKIEIKDDGSLAISVTSRPVEGKANKHLITVLSKTLRIPKSSCSIIHGEKSRNKVVAVEGINTEDFFSILQSKI